MKPKSIREKGKRLERWVAQKFRECGLDENARRMPTSGAAEGMKADIYTSLPLSCELKNCEKWEPLAYMEQAVNGARAGELPVVIMSRNKLPEPFVVMRFNDWLELLTYAKDGGWIGELPFSKKRQVNSYFKRP